MCSRQRTCQKKRNTWQTVWNTNFTWKGSSQFPEISQLFWHGICSALEYGQEIARIIILCSIIYIYMIYDWIMAWSIDITMCIYNIIYIGVSIYNYIYSHFRHMITTSAVLVKSFNLSPWFAIAWHSLCLFKSGPVTPPSSIYYHLDYGMSSKTNLCW